MSTLADLTGAPRPVVTPAGRRLDCWPLRLIELGSLEAYLESQLPAPADVLPALAIAHGLGRGAVACVARAAAGRGAEAVPRLDNSPIGDQILNSAEGIAEILRLSASRRRPRFGTRAALRLADELGEHRAARLASWAVWGPQPPGLAADAAGRALGTLDANQGVGCGARHRDPDDRLEFGKLVATLAMLPDAMKGGGGRGWAPDRVARLTLYQLKVACAGPKRFEAMDGAEIEELVNPHVRRLGRELELWSEPLA